MPEIRIQRVRPRIHEVRRKRMRSVLRGLALLLIVLIATWGLNSVFGSIYFNEPKDLQRQLGEVGQRLRGIVGR